MFAYYLWAAGEKSLSLLPGGAFLYKGLSRIVNANGRSMRRLGSCASSYRLVSTAKRLTPAGGVVVDVGTGWHHHDALLLYLCGDYRTYLFDIEDKATLEYIQVYLRHLLLKADEIARELEIDAEQARQKLRMLLALRSRAEIYRACNFTLCITQQVDRPFLPEGSVDFMISNCVLSHIPPAMLRPELIALRRMLKPTGMMYMLIGHDDHWSFHDASANVFNYYRFSDRFYRLLFDTRFEYQNRMVKSEWSPVFKDAGLEVVTYWGKVSDDTREQIRALPHIDKRFARYSLEELATRHSYFLLRPEPGSLRGEAAAGAMQAP
jgi:hypothetical protein